MKKILLLLILISVAELAVFSYYENVLVDSKLPISADAAKSTRGKIFVTNAQFSLLDVAKNKQKAAYVTNESVLNISAAGGKASSYEFQGQILYIQWIDNDSLFVGLADNGNGAQFLSLKTVNTSTKIVKDIKRIQRTTQSLTFKKIAFSAYTNDVYVLIGDDRKSQIYYFNTNGNYRTLDISSYYVEDLDTALTVNRLYFQNRKYGSHYLFERENGVTQNVGQNVVMLRTVGEKIYYGEIDGEGKIISLLVSDGNAKQQIAKLQHPTWKSNILIKDDGGVFYIAGNKYYDAKSDKEVKLSEQGGYFVINCNTLLVKQADNSVYVLND